MICELSIFYSSYIFSFYYGDIFLSTYLFIGLLADFYLSFNFLMVLQPFMCLLSYSGKKVLAQLGQVDRVFSLYYCIAPSFAFSIYDDLILPNVFLRSIQLSGSCGSGFLSFLGFYYYYKSHFFLQDLRCISILAVPYSRPQM